MSKRKIIFYFSKQSDLQSGTVKVAITLPVAKN